MAPRLAMAPLHSSDSQRHAHATTQMRDGRTFWGLAFLLRCWSASADCVVLEQPDTILSDFIHLPAPTRLRPSSFGDASRKPVNIYVRGTDAPFAPDDTAVSSSAGQQTLADFPDANSREQYRSSWARYPRMCAALAWQLVPTAPPTPTPVYADLIHAFALQWHLSGLPVPAGYADLRGQPPSAAGRQYQFCNGAGDKRVVDAVRPDGAPSQTVPSTNTPPAHGGAPVSDFISLLADGVMLCLVAVLAQPL
eukprot:5564470-Pleurochrysis_carterae.AAC.1